MKKSNNLKHFFSVKMPTVSFPNFTGSKESTVLPSIPWGLPTSSGVCLHCSHAPLSAHLHHDLYCSPQVRGR